MSQHAEETREHALEETPRPSDETPKPSDGKPVVLWTDEEVAERHSKLRQQISQLEKGVASGEATAKERDELRAEKAERQRLDDEAEHKRATEEGSEALDILSRRRAARDEAATSAKLKAEAEGKIAEAADIAQWRLDKAIEDKAKETGLSAEAIRLCGPQTLEEVSKSADLVAKIKGTPTETKLPEKPPDPGITSGGVGWRDESAEGKILYAIEHPKK